MDLAAMQQYLDVSTFQKWLGLKALEVSEGHLKIEMPWREEMTSNPANQSIHGGILASLIDLTGLYTILTTGVVATATVDLRVDYHRPALPGPVHVTGKVLKLGSKVCTAEANVSDADGKLLASGRGVYLPSS